MIDARDEYEFYHAVQKWMEDVGLPSWGRSTCNNVANADGRTTTTVTIPLNKEGSVLEVSWVPTSCGRCVVGVLAVPDNAPVRCAIGNTRGSGMRFKYQEVFTDNTDLPDSFTFRALLEVPSVCRLHPLDVTKASQFPVAVLAALYDLGVPFNRDEPFACVFSIHRLLHDPVVTLSTSGASGTYAELTFKFETRAEDLSNGRTVTTKVTHSYYDGRIGRRWATRDTGWIDKDVIDDFIRKCRNEETGKNQ